MPKSITGVSALVLVQRLASSTHHRETHDDRSSIAERQTCNVEHSSVDKIHPERPETLVLGPRLRLPMKSVAKPALPPLF